MPEAISRNNILQAASTVLAGALIFLTLKSDLGSLGGVFMIAIYFIVTSIITSIFPNIVSFGKHTPNDGAIKVSGALFTMGLILLFTVIFFII